MISAKKYPHNKMMRTVVEMGAMEDINPLTIKSRKRKNPELTYSQCATYPASYFRNKRKNKKRQTLKIYFCFARYWTRQEVKLFLNISTSSVRYRLDKIGILRTLQGDVGIQGKPKEGASGPNWNKPLRMFNPDLAIIRLAKVLSPQQVEARMHVI